MEEYLEVTTLHGLAYLQKGNASLTRIFWSIIVIVGFSLAFVFLYDQITDWENNQTITTLESIATPIHQVQFPTVTVCLLLFSKSHICIKY